MKTILRAIVAERQQDEGKPAIVRLRRPDGDELLPVHGPLGGHLGELVRSLVYAITDPAVGLEMVPGRVARITVEIEHPERFPDADSYDR